MKPELHEVDVEGHRIVFRLQRSDRTTMAISVLPTGETLVTAPRKAELDAITQRVGKRAAWILDRQAEISARPIPSTSRVYVAGETHLFLGRQYRLRVDARTTGTHRDGNRIIVGGVRPDEPKRIRNRLNRWYGREARRIFNERLDMCLELFAGELDSRPVVKVMPLEKRWGSYSRATHSLILNRGLVKAAVPQIDYVIVHELCHVRYAHHGPQFLAVLTSKMPDWRARKTALEALTSSVHS